MSETIETLETMSEEIIQYAQDAQNALMRMRPPLEFGEDDDTALVWETLEDARKLAEKMVQAVGYLNELFEIKRHFGDHSYASHLAVFLGKNP